jgi:hypothetical protein
MAALAPFTLLPCASVRAADGGADDIKAAFILNFVKYAEGPPAASDGTLQLCADRAQALSGRLDSLNGRLVLGRTVRVRAPVRPGDWHDCQVLFLDGSDRTIPADDLRALAQAPVLTISDSPGFVKAGGMIGMKLRADRVRFDINQAAARRAGLTLSSQLLKLADEVVQ